MATKARLPLLVILTAAVGCAPSTGEPLVVLSASSLADVVADVLAEVGALADTADGPPWEVRAASSSTLARQLQQGLAADLFLSADRRWAEVPPALERRPWLGNRLAWVVRRDGPELGPGEVASLVLAEPEVPVGRYAEDAMAARRWPLPDRLIRAANARDTLLKLVEGAADAAVVYTTDAALEPRVRVLLEIDPTDEPAVRAWAVLLTERGRPAFERLFAPAAVAVARARGFEPPP